MSEIDAILKQLEVDRIPLRELVYAGRTQDIIERYAEKEAKDLINQEPDMAIRRQLIAKNLPLYKACNPNSID